MIGLAFRETMSGGYHLTSAPDTDRPIHFTVKAEIDSLLAMLRQPLFTLSGEISAVGFADHKAARGTLCIDPFRGKVLVYQLNFEGNDGRPYVLSGRKTLSQGNLLQAMTVLPTGIYDASGAEVGRALLRFDLRSDIFKFLRSYHLTHS